MAHSYIDKFGYRRQRANPISRVGVFPYTGEQIDQPKRDRKTGKPIIKRDDLGEIIYKRDKKGHIEKDADGNPVPEYEMQFGLVPDMLYPVLRGPDALFNQDAIESFNGLPIRVGHLMIGDEKQNKKDEKDKKLNSADKNPNDGCIYNVRPSLDEPGYLIADFCIYTDRMKDILKEGKIRELSLGYTCIYEPEEGEFEGVPYMFKQTNLRGNHLALVKHGRCGSSVCVYDQAVITFDSLPDYEDNKENPLMENEKKEETGKLDRAKALASAIKGGDEQLAQDCLDFADFPPEVRKEALEKCKAGKCEKKDGEKDVSDKAPKSAKSAKDDADLPVPPELPKAEEKKPEPAESNAPAASTASAPAPAAEPEPNANPAGQDVPSPKEGENPAEAKDCKDKAPKAVCDKCGCNPCECKNETEAKDCKDKAVKVEGAETVEEKPNGEVEKTEVVEAKDCKDKAAKDCGTGVTQPSIPTPVAAVQGETGEKKDDKAAEAKDCKDKAPAAIEAIQVEGEKNLEDKPNGEVVKTEKVETKAEDKADKRIEADVKAENGNLPPGESKVAQDEYSAFVAEYTATQALANKLRPYIKETFDSAPMRLIDVARFAAKNIETLAFVADEADDEKVLNAVRGYAAAVAMDSAPAKQEVFEDKVKSADVIVQDEAPKQEVKKATSKDLLKFLVG